MKFSKRSKILIVGLLLLASLPYLAYQGYINYFVNPYYFPVIKKKITSYEFIEDNKALILQWDYENPIEYWITKNNKQIFEEHPRIDRKKIVQEYRKLNSVANTHNVAEGQEYWGITVYNTDGGKLTSKDYDIFKMVRNYNSDFVPSKIKNNVYVIGGKEFLDISLKSSTDDYRDSVIKTIDLNSGKIIESRNGHNNDKLEEHISPSYLYPLKSNYYIFGKELDDTALIRKKYPKAAKLLEGKNSMIVVLVDKPSIESSTVFQLLYKKGTNLFENVTIPADNSVDGQEHVVNSQEEFVKYYKFEQVSPSEE